MKLLWRAGVALLLMSIDSASAAPPVRLAVVGDSDSHAYHDALHYPGSDGRRGGAFHATTFQWTEWLHHLRRTEVDQGRWGRYGVHPLIARLGDGLGWSTRTPEKEDFAYNFAVSGAGCDDLMEGRRQVPRLARLMEDSPARWRDGIVVIRIGVNSFGQQDSLARLAGDPRDSAVHAQIDRCIAVVRAAVERLRQGRPELRMVLVGVFDNSRISEGLQRGYSPRALQNIGSALDRYDAALKAMVKTDPRLAFFDDRAWFAAHWGGHAKDGSPAYRDVVLGGIRVSNTQGDAPCHAVLADGHAGTAWNGLWAQALVELMDRRFNAGITPIRDAELVPLVRAGTRLPAATKACARS